MKTTAYDSGTRLRRAAAVCVVCFLINIAGALTAEKTGLPLYLDSAGTVFSAVVCGNFPGILVGLATNIVKSVRQPAAIYYASVNVLIAVMASYSAKKGYFESPGKLPLVILTMTVIGGGLGSVLVWFVYGFAGEPVTSDLVRTLHRSAGLPRFAAEFLGDVIIDLADKSLSVLTAWALIGRISAKRREGMRYRPWRQAPLENRDARRIRHLRLRGTSLRTKIIIVVTAAVLIAAAAATVISVTIFRTTAAGISPDELNGMSLTFCVKMISLFAGFLILTLAAAIWFADYHIIIPLNTISEAASVSARDEEERRKNAEKIRRLGICTGDEIEELYQAFSKTTTDCVSYVDEIRSQSEKITEMQDGLIMVIAEVVESRDRCTGEHVRKTARYVELILRQLKAEGRFPDVLTEDYIRGVVRSAPLHDVGKIRIPDAILNKTGKLTEEEYRIMKTHTTEGTGIIDQAIRIVPDPLYLEETRNLAKYHHENWDGSGYPCGLRGEEIPLSARVMAVADVFDALVSARSYKEGFSCDSAFGMIREGAGSRFDPVIVDAFLRQREEARRIAGEKEYPEEASPPPI